MWPEMPPASVPACKAGQAHRWKFKIHVDYRSGSIRDRKTELRATTVSRCQNCGLWAREDVPRRGPSRISYSTEEPALA